MAKNAPLAAIAAHSDEPEALLEARLAARLEELARLVETDPARAHAISLRLARALYELTGVTPTPQVHNVMAAMDFAVRGRCAWESVERMRRLASTHFFNATMFAGKGFASAMIAHLVSHLSARKPDYRYVADGFCRLLERRIPLYRGDIAVEFTHAAAIHAFLACTAGSAAAPRAEGKEGDRTP